ncbi:MAG: hypothetical protein ACM3ML_16495 [Micromonosporaceae bacterium]
MTTPTFVFSVTIVTMAILAFGTTQTYLRFSSSGPAPAAPCGLSGCARPDASHGAQSRAPARSAASPHVSASGSHERSGGGTASRHRSHPASNVTISYRTVKSVAGGFVGTISITYHRAKPVSNWQLWFRYPDVRITGITGVSLVPGEHDAVTIRSLPGSLPLQEGQTLPIIFAASGTPSAPVDCFFDNVRCHITS